VLRVVVESAYSFINFLALLFTQRIQLARGPGLCISLHTFAVLLQTSTRCRAEVAGGVAFGEFAVEGAGIGPAGERGVRLGGGRH